MRMRVAVLGVLALAACSSSAHRGAPPAPPATPTSLPSPTTPSERYMALYTNAVAPADQAIATFNTQANALTNAAQVTDLAKIATPLADTLDRVDRALLGVDWPAKLSKDIRAVVAADSAIIADLRNVSKQTALSMPRRSASW